MEEPKSTVPEDDESNSLEVRDDQSSEDTKKEQSSEPIAVASKGNSPVNIVKGFANKLNIYLLLFIFIIIIGLIIFFVIFNASQEPELVPLETQELTQEAVDDLVGSDAVVGDAKQLLTVESSAVFNGQVLIREGLDVAGPIKVGGSLSLPGITVSGNSAFDDVTINTLNIAGDATIAGQLSVAQGLSVTGPVTFSGTFSAASFAIQTLQVDGDITLNRHIDAGGPTPGVASAGAVGSGGTVTISGTDTAGTVSINVGSGAAAGVLANVTFSNAFSGSSHVVITPVATQGSPVVSASTTFYLSTRTASGFSIATSAALPSGSIAFDYIVID